MRKLLSDFSTIGRDLLSIVAQKAATTLAPGADKLAKVDRPASPDKFVTEGGQTAGKDETPVLEARVPGTDATIKHHPRQDNDVMLRGADGQERQVGEMARKGKDAVQGDYENAGGPIDQNKAKEVGRDVMGANVDNADAGEIIEEERMSKAKKQANGIQANGREYQEGVSEEESDVKKQGLLYRMKGFKVCFVVST